MAKLPKTFGVEEITKGYFPHLFNREENQAYVGELPKKEFYCPEFMTEAARSNFYSWYEERKKKASIFNKKLKNIAGMNSLYFIY